MNKHIFKLSSIIFSLSFLLIFSCTKEQIADQTTSDIIDKASFTIDSTANTGKFGCFEFVYPISFSLPDSTVLTVNSDEELKAALKSWIETQKGKGKKCDSLRPKLILPITVMTDSGATITISTPEELRALHESCKKDYFDKGNHRDHAKNRKPCFSLNFPVTVILPDSSTQVAADANALKNIAMTWKQSHPTSKGHPELVFPVSVTKKDGTVVSVNNKAELKALKTACD